MNALLDDPEIQRRYRDWHVFKYSPCSKEEGYNDQAGFHQSRAKVRLILGSNRSGKTQAMMAEVAAVALGFPYPWWFGWDHDLPSHLTIWVIVQQFPKNAAADARIKKLYIGENYLTRDRRWVFAGPLIPPEMIQHHNLDYTEVLLWNGNTISIKSNEQKQGSFASNQVDLICVDEPTEANKWRELISRMAAVPHSRLIHGLTDVTDTSEYLDQMLDTEDPELDFDQFHFTTAGMPHTDRENAAKVFKFQTKDQRQITELGLRPSDLARCYPHVFRWLDQGTGREIKNFDGGTGNWIKPFKIPHEWTRYCIHDPGVNVGAAVWFAIEPGTQNIFAYRCCHMKNPGGNVQWVIDSIHRANQGDEITRWYMDPKAAKQTPRNYIWASRDSTIVAYQRYSDRYGIQWLEGPANLENYRRESRITILTSYLNPRDNSKPMMYFFDVKDGLDVDKGLDGMPALKYEFKKFRRDDKTKKPISKHSDGIYCCEAAAVIPLRWRGNTTAENGWQRVAVRRDPIEQFMNGGEAENWREEP